MVVLSAIAFIILQIISFLGCVRVVKRLKDYYIIYRYKLMLLCLKRHEFVILHVGYNLIWIKTNQEIFLVLNEDIHLLPLTKLEILLYNINTTV